MTQLHGRRLGKPWGQPALLAHCFLSHGGIWARLIAALPAPLDALAPDLPGHGKSPMPADPGDFHALVAEAIGGLVTQPSLLIGHSFGAASLLRHALHHPAQATGLVLIEPGLFAIARDEPEHAPYLAQEAPMHAAVQGGDLAQAARHFLALNPGSPDYDALAEPVQMAMAAQMLLVVACVAGLHEDSGGLLAPGLMEGFDVPVLLMVGSETTPIFHAMVRALARRLPRAEIAVIAGAGHMVPASHPREAAAAIQGWMQRTGQGHQAATENPRVG